MASKKVVILGAGYGGVHAAQVLNKLSKSGQDVEITLINKTPYHVLLTELHEVAGSRVHPDAVRLSLKRVFKKTPVNVVEDTITSVDFKGQKVLSEKNEYKYDYLVLSFGSEPAFFGIPGIQEHSFTMWSFDDAIAVKNQVIDMFVKASREKDPPKRQELLTFVVGGGGFTGIEMMGELFEWVDELCLEYGVDRNEVKLLVVEAMSRILTNLGDKSMKKAVKYMNKKGVEILTNSPITKVNEDSIELKSGRVIRTRTLIWTGGVQNDKLSQEMDIKLGKRGRIEANDYMQSQDHENVYVVGDNVSYVDKKVGPVPPLVESALQTADCAARNIMNDIKGAPKKAFSANLHGVMVSIGGGYSVSELGRLKLSWIFSDLMKHFVNIHYLFGVGGLSFVWDYIHDHFLKDKKRRTFAGGLLYGKTSGLWLTALRMFLGIMWFKSSMEHIASGWLSVDASSSASILSTITGDNAVSWYKTFVDSVVAPHLGTFLTIITITELLLGVALFFGGLTVLAAFGSVVMDINFFLSGTGDWWFLVSSLIVMFSNAGMYFGADYFIIPLLKSWLGFDKKSYSIK
jgi:NADH dehydrogenase